MGSIQLNTELATLHSQERLDGEISIDSSDATTARSGEIVWTTPDGDFTTRTGAGDIAFDALEVIRSFRIPRRNTPTLSTGTAPSVSLDATFRSGIEFQGYQIAITRATGATTSTALATLQAEVLDSLWPLSRVNVAGGVALTSRGQLTTLPGQSLPAVPHLFYYFIPNGGGTVAATVRVRAAPSPVATVNLTLNPGLNIIRLPFYTIQREVEIPQVGGNSEVVIYQDPITQIDLTIGANTWLFHYNCDVREVMVCKERSGGFITLGFDTATGQPASSLPALRRTYPPRSSDYPRPPINPSERVSGRSLTLARNHITTLERQTFAAFMDAQQFWYYDKNEARLKPCTLTGGTAINPEETTSAEISIELFID